MSTQADQLSVVIITRNEEKNIARTLESVLHAVEHRPPPEIIVVDSASQDQTIEIAKQYPVNIVRLHPSWVMTAAAGRYIGTYYTQSDLILYLDGDMEFFKEWLDDALSFMAAHPDVVGVSGIVQDVHLEDGQIIAKQAPVIKPASEPIPVKHFGGAALYRRVALEQVGGFNPYIVSDEEPELCIRLRHAGYTLILLPRKVCHHYCIPQKSLLGHLRRAKMNYFLGFGQIPRYHLGTPLFRQYLVERGSYLVYLLAMVITVITFLLTLLSGNLLFFGTWLVIVIAFLLVYLIKKRSLRAVALGLLFETLTALNAVRGFLRTPIPPEDYPTDAEIIQVRYHRGKLA